MSLCMNPQFACEVTLQPLDRYPLDAAILFSDILTIPDAMGQGLYFETGEGPRFKKVISTPADIEALPIPDPHKDLGYVMDAVSTIRRELNGRVPLIGFSGSPWTLATYMVEGGSSKDFRKTKAMLYDNPQALHLLLDKLAQSVTSYLNGQIQAGAQAVQIFDTWGGNLSAAAYREFSLAYMRKIVSGLIREHEGRKVPVILFTKNGGLWLESIAEAGADALGLTGPARSAMPVAGSVTRSLCRATWTRLCCMPSPKPSARKWRGSWQAMAMAAVMCSTWAMALRLKSTRNTPVRSSTPCTSCRRNTTLEFEYGRLHLLMQVCQRLPCSRRKAEQLQARVELALEPVCAVSGRVLEGNRLKCRATSNATTNRLPMNRPMPFQPAWCQNTPPAVPAMLEPA